MNICNSVYFENMKTNIVLRLCALQRDLDFYCVDNVINKEIYSLESGINFEIKTLNLIKNATLPFFSCIIKEKK